MFDPAHCVAQEKQRMFHSLCVHAFVLGWLDILYRLSAETVRFESLASVAVVRLRTWSVLYWYAGNLGCQHAEPVQHTRARDEAAEDRGAFR